MRGDMRPLTRSMAVIRNTSCVAAKEAGRITPGVLLVFTARRCVALRMMNKASGLDNGLKSASRYKPVCALGEQVDAK